MVAGTPGGRGGGPRARGPTGDQTGGYWGVGPPFTDPAHRTRQTPQVGSRCHHRPRHIWQAPQPQLASGHHVPQRLRVGIRRPSTISHLISSHISSSHLINRHRRPGTRGSGVARLHPGHRPTTPRPPDITCCTTTGEERGGVGPGGNGEGPAD